MNFYKIADKYYGFWTTILEKSFNPKLYPFDFNKGWLAPIFDKKFTWLFIISGEAVTKTVMTSLPLIIEKIAAYRQISMFGWLIGLLVLIEIYRFFTVTTFCYEQMELLEGLLYRSFKFFLTVDPSDHFTRESGKLFNKVNRGIKAYEDFLDVITYEFLPIIFGSLTIMVTFFFIDTKLGMLASIMLAMVYFINIATTIFNEVAFEPYNMKAQDEAKSSIMEGLNQVFLIRSTFASNQWNKKVYKKTKKFAFEHSTLWVAFIAITALSRIAHIVSSGILGIYVFNAMNAGDLTSIKAVAIIITYIRGSFASTRIGRKTYKLTKSHIEIQDLYNFIRTFGKQTFPVLKDDINNNIKLIPGENLSVKAENLHFKYTEKAHIFENHNLKLVTPKSQTNKLYGIIGPSGIGKTTLISILGGQLPPTSGSILINGTSIYDVDDSTRRRLIALQGQTASNLSGTIRSNLLLGAQKASSLYNDEKLVELLQKVGLWKIFAEKEGLNSVIGEGGLTLSLGQRQRLNFASLYLRTKFLKPALILIDEPTSSLDEISERSITDMINELAQDSITIVIAHRINTLNSAVGLLDFSLFNKEKDLIFHTREELLEKSDYYKKLLTGKVSMDE